MVVSGPLFFSRDENWNRTVSENAIVTISKIAKFLTGSSKIPATGLNKNVTLKFKHRCLPCKNGNIFKCLQTVSTCEIIVNIPVSHKRNKWRMHLKMHYYVKLDLVLFKSFKSAGHTYEEFALLFFSTLSITVYVQNIIWLDLSEKMTKDFKVLKFLEKNSYNKSHLALSISKSLL